MEHWITPKEKQEEYAPPFVLLLDDSLLYSDRIEWISNCGPCCVLHMTDSASPKAAMERAFQRMQEAGADPTRFYLVGAGEMADLAWKILAEYSRVIAACIMIGGYGDPYLIRKAKFVPLQGFSGGRQMPGNGKEMVYSLRCAGSQVSTYAEDGRELDETVWKWMFQQNKMAQYEIHWLKPGLWNIESGKIESSYLITGTEKALLIDTGMATEPILPLLRNLTSLPIELAVTHSHGDHMLHADEFQKVYISPKEAEMPRDFLRTMMPGKTFRPESFLPIQDGDIIDLGGKQIEVFAAFGHTPGSLVFADHQAECFFAGDAFGSGMGVLMAIPGTQTLSFYLDHLRGFLRRASAFRHYVFYGGHWIQESAEQREYGRYTPLSFEMLEDMAALCEKLLQKDTGSLTWTQQNGSWVEEPVYYVTYRSAAMWVTKSVIQ